jgi:hypothetical protein
MLAISLFCAAVGLALGARFRIFVLIPAMVLALVTIISYGVAARLGFREAATTLVIGLAALQLSYFGANLVSGLAYKPGDRFKPRDRHKPRDRWIPQYHL